PARDHAATVVGALRTLDMVVDVPERLEVACPAVRAPLDRAIRREDAVHRTGEVLEEEFPAHPRVEVIPGQHLLERAAAEVEVGIEPVRGERRRPYVEPTMLRPAVEAGARTLRRLEPVGHPA